MSAANIEPWVDAVHVYRDEELICKLGPITRIVYSYDGHVEITVRVET